MRGRTQLAFLSAILCLLSFQNLVAEGDAENEPPTTPLELTVYTANTIKDPYHRAITLLQIADSQVYANDKQGALKTLELAVAPADSIPDTSSLEKKTALTSTASLIAKAGDIKKAVEVARLLQPSRYRVALGKVASALAAAGSIKQALQIANADSSHRQYVFSRIVVALSHAGDIPNALKVVQYLEDKSRWDDKRSSIVNITVGKAKKSNDVRLLNEAIQIVPEFETLYQKLSAHIVIGKALAEMGKKERSVKLFNEILDGIPPIKNSVWQSTMLFDVGEGLLIAGERQQGLAAFDRAAKAAEDLSHPPSQLIVKARVSRNAGSSLAEHGHQDECLRLLEKAIQESRKLDEPQDRAAAFAEIASAYATVGAKEQASQAFQEAQEAAKEWEAANRRAGSAASQLWGTATAMAKAGMFQEALDMALALENPKSRHACVEGIVRLLVKAGKYELAAEAVLQLEPVDLRDLALANLASQLGSEKRVEQAMKVANQIEDAKQKDVAFQLCAFSLERADEAKQAIGVAQKIENASMKEYVMNRIAKDVTAKGNLDAALELITNHYEPIQRGGLVDCVRILAMSGHMKQAMDATRKCRVLECRIRALSQIAIILATEPASTKQRTPPTSPPRRMKKDFSAEAARSVERLIELAKAAHN